MPAYTRYRTGDLPFVPSRPAGFALHHSRLPTTMFLLSSIAGGLLFTAFFIGSLGLSGEG